MNLGTGRRYECAIAVVVLGASFAKAAFLTTFTGPGHLMFTAVELLREVYGADKSCGVSDAIMAKIEQVASPAHSWLEREIINWMSRGGAGPSQ